MSFRSILTTRNPAYSVDHFTTLQRALQRSMDDAWTGLPASALTEAAAMSVKMDVKEDDKVFHVTADLPGLTEKEVERDEKQDTWHIIERSSGSFARKLSLSAPIDASKIEAKFEKGVLSITLPKQPQEQNNARKIEIKTA